VRNALTNRLHKSDDPMVLREVHRIWGSIVERRELPWPAPARRRFEERGAEEAMRT